MDAAIAWDPVMSKELCKTWALDKHSRMGHPPLTSSSVRAAYEQDNRGALDSEHWLDVAMAQLHFHIYATVLVHFVRTGVTPAKLRELQTIVAAPIGRREYWNKLDRAYFYTGGLIGGRYATLGGDVLRYLPLQAPADVLDEAPA